MHGQEQLLKYKNIKVYLARFINKITRERFFKFGVTGKYDAAKRFTDKEYDLWDIKIMATAYGPTLEVLELEQELLHQYPKNFYLPEKIKGVREIFKIEAELEHATVNKIITFMKERGNIWYDQRKILASHI